MLYRRAVLAGVIAASFALGALTAPSPAAAHPEAALAIPQRQLDHAEQRIRVLEQRRAYLHRYIRDLRARLHAPVAPPMTTSSAPASTTSAPSYSGGVLSASQVASYARGAGFPESVIPEMVAIAYRESNFCPTAVFGYGCAGSGHAYAGGPACGIWELFPCPGPEALNPATNAALAFQKYQASGLAPWATTS